VREVSVGPLRARMGSEKKVYRAGVAPIDDTRPRAAFILKRAPRPNAGFWFMRPRGAFKWREVERLRALDGKDVTPRFGAHLKTREHDAFTEELIEGVTLSDPRVSGDPERVREIARMWMTIARLLGGPVLGALWRVPGSTMSCDNAMYRMQGGEVRGSPVVVDLGRVRLRTPGRILRKLCLMHGEPEALLRGIAEALGSGASRRFFAVARWQLRRGAGGDAPLRHALDSLPVRTR